jgi:hypothetical protein
LFEVMMTAGRCGRERSAGLVDEKLHAVEFAQQIVREFDVGLVDFVDQHDRRLVAFEGLPEHALHDVTGRCPRPWVAELRVAQPRDGIVFVEPLLGLGRRLDVPLEKRQAERLAATSSASMVLPVPGSPLISSGRCRVMAALTAMSGRRVVT